MRTAQEWIDQLGLEPHPEGGYFKQTEVSPLTTDATGKPLPLYTSIYFLLTPDSPSHFHRLTADEMWFFHDGNPLTVHSLTPSGDYEKVELGRHFSAGQRVHYTVPAGTIFGSTVEQDFALVSCVVVPGFDFSEFELFTKKALLRSYPEHESIITILAYDKLPE